jgi:hypothetical protein
MSNIKKKCIITKFMTITIIMIIELNVFNFVQKCAKLSEIIK